MLRVSLPVLLLLGSGCVGNPYEPLDPDVDPVVEGDWYRPDLTTTWQWQLTVADDETPINTSYAVEVFDIDLFDVSAAEIATIQASGRRVICYFSAGSWEEWRPDADQFDDQDTGRKLDGWDGERWLNIRSPRVLEIMFARLDLAVDKGCDGVEPDNVDGYTNSSGFELLASDQLAFNRTLANAAHERGLAVGLKNSGDQVAELVDYFDFSLNEQCHEYSECAQLRAFTLAGKPIWNAEYVGPDTLEAATSAAPSICASALAADMRTLILPLDLDDRFRVSCDEL